MPLFNHLHSNAETARKMTESGAAVYHVVCMYAGRAAQETNSNTLYY